MITLVLNSDSKALRLVLESIREHAHDEAEWYARVPISPDMPASVRGKDGPTFGQMLSAWDEVERALTQALKSSDANPAVVRHIEPTCP